MELDEELPDITERAIANLLAALISRMIAMMIFMHEYRIWRQLAMLFFRATMGLVYIRCGMFSEWPTWADAR